MGVTLGGTERTTAAELREVGELLAYLRQPEPPRGHEGRAGAAAAGAHRDEHAARRRCKRAPVQEVVLTGDDIDLAQAADPDLLAGRAGAADHLAAGGDQGPRRGPRGRLQPRHLPHAGDRQGPHHHALARPPRRRPAPPALEGGRQARAAARLRGHRRRSRDHPGGRDAGARTRCRSTSSPACCAAPRSTSSRAKTVPLLVPAAGRDRDRGPRPARRVRRRGARTATTPATTTPSSASRCSRSAPSPCGATRSTSPPTPAARRTSRRVLGEALNEVFIPLFQQQFPEIVDFWLPPEGCSYRIAVVSMKKAYPGHAKRVMLGVWSLPSPVHVHQVGDRGGRRHRRPRLEGRDVGDLHPHGPGPRHHRDREHPDRLPRLRLARSRAWARRSASTPPTSGRRKPSATGAARSRWTRTWWRR